jgi:hypothetical protein
MPLVFTPTADHSKTQHVIGDLQILVGTLTFSGSYAAGGEVPTGGIKQLFRQFGVGDVISILGDARGNSLEFDNVNDKIKVYTAANVEHTVAAYNAALTASPVPVAILGR